MRELKRLHRYSIGEQEEMLPFERQFLLEMIRQEGLEDADVPAQGWSKYAEEIGATRKGKYTTNYKVLDY